MSEYNPKMKKMEKTGAANQLREYITKSDSSLSKGGIEVLMKFATTKLRDVDESRHKDVVYTILKRAKELAAHGKRVSTTAEDIELVIQMLGTGLSNVELAPREAVDAVVSLERLKKILKVSSRIKLDMLRSYLRMEEEPFIEHLVDWATEFGFRIDGDYVDIGKSDVDKFVASIGKKEE
jgi:histone H3/H4